MKDLDFYPIAIEKLIEEFAKLPGIGYKTAQRLTLYVLNLPKEEVKEFSEALVKLEVQLNIVLYVVILQIKILVLYVVILIGINLLFV